MFKSFTAAAARTATADHDYSTARGIVRGLAQSGRVTLDKADKHNNGVARVMIDGEAVGPASSLMVSLEWADEKAILGV